MCTLGFLSYLLGCVPIILRKQLFLELLNDIAEVLLLYHLMIFSDWQENEEIKSWAAYSFNGVVLGTIAIHFFFLVYTLVS